MNKLKYYYNMDQLSDEQKKQLFVASLVWGSNGNYVGDNAGMVMNDDEAFDGDVHFSDSLVDSLMCDPECVQAAVLVAGSGVPVYWSGVVNRLSEMYRKAYWNNRITRIIELCRTNLTITNLDIEHARTDDAYAALLYTDVETYRKIGLARMRARNADKQ